MRVATCGASISLAVFLQSSDNALGPTNVDLIAHVPSRRASNTTKIRSSGIDLSQSAQGLILSQ